MTTLDKLSQIIPQDQALANKALAVSMKRITGIDGLTLPQFASAVGNVQTTYGLPQINALTSAVSPAAANAIIASVGTGSGPHNTVGVNDILGTAGGYVSANALANVTTIITHMPILGTASNAASLTGIYTYMKKTVNGDFGDPIAGPVEIPDGPAAGIYDTANYAFIGQTGNITPDPSGTGNVTTGGPGLLSVAQSEVGYVVSAQPSSVSKLNSNWQQIINQLSMEANNQKKANLDFTQLTPNSTTSIYSFVMSLPSYGQQTTVGGMAPFLQSVANTNNLGGQAIIAAMRQGQTSLGSSGILSNAQVPAAPNPPLAQAPLLPTAYPYPPSKH